MRRWYYDASDKPAYYQDGAWLFDLDGLPTFFVSKGSWFKDGRVAFHPDGKWMVSTEGEALFYTA